MPDLLADTYPTPRSAPPRPPRGAPPRPQERRQSRVLSGVGAAALAAAIGLLIVEAVALVVWMAEPRTSAPLSDALRTGAAFWLLGHGGRLHLPAGTAGLMPLGLTLIFAGLSARAGAAVARVRLSGPRRRTIVLAAAAVAVPYALIAAVLAGIASSADLEASAETAAIGAFVLSFLGAAVGAARELPMAVPKPNRWRALATGIGVAGGVLIAGSAVLAAVALAIHVPDAAELAKPARAGAVGGVGMLVLQAALAPNVVTWSAAYLLGPGFAVGTGTLVSPGSTHLGDVPGLPMLAALPSGAAPWPVYALFAVPVAAGLLGGFVMIRRLPRTPKLATAAVLGAGVGAAVALLLAAAALLSGGPVTGGRLETVGPSALPVGLHVLLLVAIPSTVAAFGLTWRRQYVAGHPRTEEVALPPAQTPAEEEFRRSWAGRLVGRLDRAGHAVTDAAGVVENSMRRAGAATWRGFIGLPMLPVRLARRGLRRGEIIDLTEPDSGKVSLIKAPHDPYELFRDSLADELDDDHEDDVDDEPKRRRLRLRRKDKVIKLPE
jgi:hypothetical protein